MFVFKKLTGLLVLVIALYIILQRRDLMRDGVYAVVGLAVIIKNELAKLVAAEERKPLVEE